MFIMCFFCMLRVPPRTTQTDTLGPFTTLFRYDHHVVAAVAAAHCHGRQQVVLGGNAAQARGRSGGILVLGQVEVLLDLVPAVAVVVGFQALAGRGGRRGLQGGRSEEHTSELQSLMRISYAVFCLKKKKHQHQLVTLTVYITAVYL